MKKNRSRLYVTVLTLAIVACFLAIVCTKSISSASTDTQKDIYYTSVEVQPGDSLWSIATQYYTDDWKDVNHYMETIMEFNGLSNDRIYAGNYLSIPYFAQ